MNLSIITVTYNSENCIKTFLTKLIRKIPEKTEILIIDNNSSDNTLEIIKEFKNVQLIENKTNLGFSKANNLGVEKAKGDYLLFLNPDTEALDNSIANLLEFLIANPSTGIVVPRLILSDGTIQKSVRRLPTLLGVIKEYYMGFKNAYSEYVPSKDETTYIEAAYGAAMLIKRELFLKLKGFDERFFLYYEDLDLCRKVINQGLEIVYYPKAVFKHQLGLSTKEIIVSKSSSLIRAAANFFPIKKTGRYYYQVQSANIYHGILKAFLIHLLIFISLKFKPHEAK